MKEFRYKLGHVHYKTMTVCELIEKLSEYPANMPVITTWETLCVGLEDYRFSIEKDFHGGMGEDKCDILMIDVDQY